VGYAKEAPFADDSWADGASHMGSLQDPEARKYDSPNDETTEKDLSGGWYDAGDYNKYTPWTSNYIYELLSAYEENPEVWTDDFNLPESGNGIPDIIDEIKWGMDHLLRLQLDNGSMISVVSESHASPPSAVTGQTLYGDVNTTSTIAACGAFAYGSKIYRQLGFETYADTLQDAAENAWLWANENPNVLWYNNNASYGSEGIGAGQQETTDYKRFGYKMRAAAHLFENTGLIDYQEYFEANYQSFHLFEWTFAYPFELREQNVLLYYTKIDAISETVSNSIVEKYNQAMLRESNFQAYENQTDGYLAFIDSYTWGSNHTKCSKGMMFYDMVTYNINTSKHDEAMDAAENYLHYIHGVNPMNLVYLSNMYSYGGDQCVNQFYHTWFANGSTQWDEVGVSTYGPAPGFLTGGPNPNYSIASCCPDNCGGTSNNALCTSEDLSPPENQPNAKSYKDFNTSWPLNSWEITENSCGYQTMYLRLLSKFASVSNDPVSINKFYSSELNLIPNPTSGTFTLRNIGANQEIKIYDHMGNLMLELIASDTTQLVDISSLNSGVYIISCDGRTAKITKN